MPENGDATPASHLAPDFQLPGAPNPGHHIRPPAPELADLFREHTAAMDRLTDALKKSSFSEDIATRLSALEAKTGGAA